MSERPVQPMGSLERRARVAIFFALLGAVSVAFEIAARVALWTTPDGNPERARRGNALCAAWGRTMTSLLLRSFDARLAVSGAVPAAGRYVIACNHQSSADIVLLVATLRALDLKFVAKRELGRNLPFVSVATRRFGHALVSRDPTRDDLAGLHRMARELGGWSASAVVFPEGTRSRDGAVLPYRTGALRVLAKECDLPLLPVALDGTHVAADLSQYARRMPRARFALIVGEPIAAEQWRHDVDAAARRVHDWTAAAIAGARAS